MKKAKKKVVVVSTKGEKVIEATMAMMLEFQRGSERVDGFSEWERRAVQVALARSMNVVVKGFLAATAEIQDELANG